MELCDLSFIIEFILKVFSIGIAIFLFILLISLLVKAFRDRSWLIFFPGLTLLLFSLLVFTMLLLKSNC